MSARGWTEGRSAPPLVARYLPRGGESTQAFEVIAVLLAAVSVALLARIAVPFPGSPVPVTGQSLGVLLAGGLLGSWRGAISMLVYLAAGAAGLPVFAHGGSGVGHLTGATGGYLLAFLVGAALTGWLVERGWDRRFVSALAATLLATAVLLLIGGGRLAMLLGPAGAWSAGVAPFLVGGVLKAALAALVIRAAAGLRR